VITDPLAFVAPYFPENVGVYPVLFPYPRGWDAWPRLIPSS
jgi:hypothetical protein